jgi:hypothetical protein
MLRSDAVYEQLLEDPSSPFLGIPGASSTSVIGTCKCLKRRCPTFVEVSHPTQIYKGFVKLRQTFLSKNKSAPSYINVTRAGCLIFFCSLSLLSPLMYPIYILCYPKIIAIASVQECAAKSAIRSSFSDLKRTMYMGR